MFQEGGSAVYTGNVPQGSVEDRSYLVTPPVEKQPVEGLQSFVKVQK